MEEELRLDDSVLHRLVQILQEALLLGVDISDIMRQIRLVKDDEQSGVLVLSPAYKQMVKEHHAKLEAEAKVLQEERAMSGLIVVPDESEPDGGSN